MDVEVERGHGVFDSLQVMPCRRVLSADDHQGAGLGARHQPIAGLVRDLDRHEAQDGAGVNLLQDEQKQEEGMS